MPPSRQLWTRRQFVASSIAVAGGVVLAACGDDDGASSPPTTTETTAGTAAPPASSVAPTTTAASAPARFPVTVTGALGSITLDHAPTRVATPGYLRDTDIAVALGVVPVGAADPGLFPGGLAPWVVDALAGREQPVALSGQATNFEQVAGLRPDLILATDSFTLADDYQNLSAIAPTLSYKTGRNDDSWQTMATHIGPALGLAPEAADLVADVERQLVAARDDNPQLAGKTFTFGPVQPDGTIFTISSTDDASAGLLAQLGLVLSPAVTTLPETSTPNRAQVSLEQIGLLDADVVILVYRTDADRERCCSNRCPQWSGAATSPWTSARRWHSPFRPCSASPTA